MNKPKVLSMLGIARKASKTALGYDPVIEAVMKGKVCLILLASDISPKSAKGICLAAEYDNITVAETQISMDEFGNAIGKRCGIIGITDEGIAKTLQTLLS